MRGPDYDFVPVPTDLFDFPFASKVAFQIVARCFRLCWNSRSTRYEPRLTTMVELASLCSVGRQTLYDNWKAVLHSGFVAADRMGRDTMLLSVSERFADEAPVLAVRNGETTIENYSPGVHGPYNGGRSSLPSSLGNLESSSRDKTPVVRRPYTSGIVSPEREGERIGDLLIGFGVRLSVARILCERPGLTYLDTLRIVKDCQMRGHGPGALVDKLRGGDPVPGICEDCGNSLMGVHNDWCPTCRDRQREGYLAYTTLDDDDNEKA